MAAWPHGRSRRRPVGASVVFQSQYVLLHSNRTVSGVLCAPWWKTNLRGIALLSKNAYLCTVKLIKR